MKISVFQGVLLGVFGLAAAIGLFVFANYTANNSGNSVGSVTIWGTIPADDMQSGLNESTRLDNSLKGVSYVEKSAATLVTDLAAAIATGAGPDLILASQEELVSLTPFLRPVPLSTLSSRTFTDTFADGGGVFEAPGEAGYYGIPFLIDPLVLYYNRSVLASSGIASAPSTWESLTGLVPRITELTPTRDITRATIGMGTYGNVRNARGILSTLYLQTRVSIATRTGFGQLSPNLGLSTPAEGGLPPGVSVVRFYTQFADPSKVSYTWNASLPDSEQFFGTGDLAFYLGYASEARFLRGAYPNLSFDVAPVPQPATASGKTTYGLIYAFMIPSGADNPGGAYNVAAILSGNGQQQALAQSTGLAPATRAAIAAPPAGDPIAAVAASSALYVRGWLSPAPASTDQVFGAMINDVITGRLVLENAITTAERSLGALLEP